MARDVTQHPIRFQHCRLLPCAEGQNETFGDCWLRLRLLQQLHIDKALGRFRITPEIAAREGFYQKKVEAAARERILAGQRLMQGQGCPIQKQES